MRAVRISDSPIHFVISGADYFVHTGSRITQWLFRRVRCSSCIIPPPPSKTLSLLMDFHIFYFFTAVSTGVAVDLHNCFHIGAAENMFDHLHCFFAIGTCTVQNHCITLQQLDFSFDKSFVSCDIGKKHRSIAGGVSAALIQIHICAVFEVLRRRISLFKKHVQSFSETVSIMCLCALYSLYLRWSAD